MPNSNIEQLKNLLDYTSLKQKVISKNIANAGTLGYQRKDVEFRDILENGLKETVKTTSSKHITMNDIERSDENTLNVINDKSSVSSSGINNVDIDKEMAEMAENTIMFKFAARKMNAYFRNMQKVIKGGG